MVAAAPRPATVGLRLTVACLVAKRQANTAGQKPAESKK